LRQGRRCDRDQCYVAGLGLHPVDRVLDHRPGTVEHRGGQGGTLASASKSACHFSFSDTPSTPRMSMRSKLPVIASKPVAQMMMSNSYSAVAGLDAGRGFGGGAFLVPDRLAGISDVVRVPHGDRANAVGAATAQISGETDQVYRDLSRADAIAAAEAQAVARATEAGAERTAAQWKKRRRWRSTSRRARHSSTVAGA
jgi:hypothetical protein